MTEKWIKIFGYFRVKMVIWPEANLNCYLEISEPLLKRFHQISTNFDVFFFIFLKVCIVANVTESEAFFLKKFAKTFENRLLVKVATYIISVFMCIPVLEVIIQIFILVSKYVQHYFWRTQTLPDEVLC